MGDPGRRFLSRLCVTVFPKSKTKPADQGLGFGQSVPDPFLLFFLLSSGPRLSPYILLH